MFHTSGKSGIIELMYEAWTITSSFSSLCLTTADLCGQLITLVEGQLSANAAHGVLRSKARKWSQNTGWWLASSRALHAFL